MSNTAKDNATRSIDAALQAAFNLEGVVFSKIGAGALKQDQQRDLLESIQNIKESLTSSIVALSKHQSIN